MKTNRKWILAAAALVTLAFANCSGPAYYDDYGVPNYTDSYYTDGSGQLYYNVVPVDAYIGHGEGRYGDAPAASKEYYYRGRYHRGDFHLRNYCADSFR